METLSFHRIFSENSLFYKHYIYKTYFYSNSRVLICNRNEIACSAWHFSLTLKVVHLSSLENVFQQVTSNFSEFKMKNPELFSGSASLNQKVCMFFNKTPVAPQNISFNILEPLNYRGIAGSE